MIHQIKDEAEMKALGAEMLTHWKAGDVVRLEGPLGAGKTTFVRGLLESLNVDGPVRSPTFSLIQLYETNPPVLHADLYRLKSAAGLGLEDYECTHLMLIEWPDRLGELFDPNASWTVTIEFDGEGRSVSISTPSRYSF